MPEIYSQRQGPLDDIAAVVQWSMSFSLGFRRYNGALSEVYPFRDSLGHLRLKALASDMPNLT